MDVNPQEVSLNLERTLKSQVEAIRQLIVMMVSRRRDISQCQEVIKRPIVMEDSKAAVIRRHRLDSFRDEVFHQLSLRALCAYLLMLFSRDTASFYPGPGEAPTDMSNLACRTQAKTQYFGAISDQSPSKFIHSCEGPHHDI